MRVGTTETVESLFMILVEGMLCYTTFISFPIKILYLCCKESDWDLNTICFPPGARHVLDYPSRLCLLFIAPFCSEVCQSDKEAVT